MLCELGSNMTDDFVGNKSADASSGAAAADTSQAEGEMLQSFEERKKSDAKDNQKFVVSLLVARTCHTRRSNLNVCTLRAHVVA